MSPRAAAIGGGRVVMVERPDGTTAPAGHVAAAGQWWTASGWPRPHKLKVRGNQDPAEVWSWWVACGPRVTIKTYELVPGMLGAHCPDCEANP